MKKSFAVIAFLIATFFTSCDAGEKDEVVTIKTPYGDMVVILYAETPKHKENFLKLVKDKYYDSLLFHRVIQGFMIQGGDPDSKTAGPEAQLGGGGPAYTIPAEFNRGLFHEKGALAAARLGDQQNPGKESSGSQFYIVQGTVVPEDQLKIDRQKMTQAFQQMAQSGQYQPLFDSLEMLYKMNDLPAYQAKLISIIPRCEKATGIKVSMDVTPEAIAAYTTVGGTPFLDGQYTVFGKVIKGLEVVDKIAEVNKNPSDRPVEDIWMVVTSEKMSKKKIEKEYGYKYPAAPKKG
jgi:cyclophilin family peptidyl-prolyl cis-trans isomerase